MTYEAICTKEITDEHITFDEKTEVYHFISEKYKIRDQGETIFMTLDPLNNLINSYVIHVGIVDENTLDIKDICYKAIMDKASQVVICRLRPAKSYSFIPSGSDYSIAEKIFRAMKIFNIKVRYQLIIGKEGYAEIKNDHNSEEDMKQD
jgi:DNA repair protein RadC